MGSDRESSVFRGIRTHHLEISFYDIYNIVLRYCQAEEKNVQKNFKKGVAKLSVVW